MSAALHESQATRKMHASPVSESDAITDLEARVRVMRKLGVTKWGDIELGTEPSKDGDKAETQQEHDPETLEKRRRARQHASAMSATARLVPRLGGND